MRPGLLPVIILLLAGCASTVAIHRAPLPTDAIVRGVIVLQIRSLRPAAGGIPASAGSPVQAEVIICERYGRVDVIPSRAVWTYDADRITVKEGGEYLVMLDEAGRWLDERAVEDHLVRMRSPERLRPIPEVADALIGRTVP